MSGSFEPKQQTLTPPKVRRGRLATELAVKLIIDAIFLPLNPPQGSEACSEELQKLTFVMSGCYAKVFK